MWISVHLSKRMNCIYLFIFCNRFTFTHRLIKLLRGFTFTQQKCFTKMSPRHAHTHTAINEYKLIYANAFNCKCASTIFTFCKHAILYEKKMRMDLFPSTATVQSVELLLLLPLNFKFVNETLTTLVSHWYTISFQLTHSTHTHSLWLMFVNERMNEQQTATTWNFLH